MRVARPTGHTSRTPSTIPVAVAGEPSEDVETDDPHELADELWRDPSLVGVRATLVSSDQTQVFHITDPAEEAAEAEEVEEETEERDEEVPPPAVTHSRKRSFAAVSTVQRSAFQARRHREVPQAAAPTPPDGPPDDNDDPEEPNAPDDDDSWSEPEDEQPSEPEAPPEEEDFDFEEGAADQAPQETHSAVLQPTSKLPATRRGSVARFLEPDSSADRSRSRNRPTPPSAGAEEQEEEVPVATTVSSQPVSGHIEIRTFKDGRKVQVFVPDQPIPKVYPLGK